jgi:hypothetical protein
MTIPWLGDIIVVFFFVVSSVFFVSSVIFWGRLRREKERGCRLSTAEPLVSRNCIWCDRRWLSTKASGDRSKRIATGKQDNNEK